MANVSKNILLVEGESDKYFFNQFIKCFCSSLSVDVKVVTPKDVSSGGYNNKQGAFAQLSLLSKGTAEQMRLGLIVDADQKNHGGGVANTIEQLNQALVKNQFQSGIKSQTNSGYFFEHALHKCGVWITPNNQDDGIVEDFLLQSVKDKPNQSLLQHAKQIVDGLPTPTNFNAHKISKAYFSTWLAWQEQPSEISNLFRDHLIDENNIDFINLKSWLIELFS